MKNPAPGGPYPKGIEAASPERRGVSHRRVIAEAKEMVQTIALADRLCGPCKMRRIGDRWVAKCPLPGHDDKTPSFTVFVATNSWYCFGACQHGGDVVDLAVAAWGIENPAIAAAEILMTYCHPIPERPPAWFRKQERQPSLREKIDWERFEHLRRRLYRWFFRPLVEAVEDEEGRRHDEQKFWEATEPLARHIIRNVMPARDEG